MVEGHKRIRNGSDQSWHQYFYGPSIASMTLQNGSLATLTNYTRQYSNNTSPENIPNEYSIKLVSNFSCLHLSCSDRCCASRTDGILPSHCRPMNSILNLPLSTQFRSCNAGTELLKYSSSPRMTCDSPSRRKIHGLMSHLRRETTPFRIPRRLRTTRRLFTLHQSLHHLWAV